MRAQGLARVLVVSVLVLLPAVAWAQSSITGVVRDASGGVLPGVTVEAGSPVQPARRQQRDQHERDVRAELEGRHPDSEWTAAEDWRAV